jgi:4-hydroxybenzoate polyprenyltransferase
MRPYLVFVSGAAGLCGLAFIPAPVTWRVVLAFIPLFLSYGLGQALTDCFQIDTDSISSPYRPLVKGIISPKQVLPISLAGLVAGVLIIGLLNHDIFLLGVLAVAGLLSYTFFKRRWWGGPAWNSWIMALLPVIGRLTGGDIRLSQVFSLEGSGYPLFLFAVMAVFFGYANFVVMGYLKDISADRATGYQTFPVVFGWKATAIFSDILAVATAVCTGLIVFYPMGLPGGALMSLAAQSKTSYIILIYAWRLGCPIVFALSLGLSALAQIQIHRIRDESRAHRPIANVVRVFLLSCLAIILKMQPGWVWFLAIFYFAFELTLKSRPEKRQV